MLKKILRSYVNSKKLDEMYDIELIESENSLKFSLIETEKSKKIPLLKKYLVLKNRENKKEIVKEISKSATINGEDAVKLESGTIDPFLRFKVPKKTIQIRPKFLKQHEDKSLMDSEKEIIFESYPTVNKKLSFVSREGILKTYLESVENNGECLKFNGKVKIPEGIEFDKMEILAKSKKDDTLTFPCEWEKNGELHDFSFELNSNQLREDLKDLEINSSWSLNLVLKSNEDVIDCDKFRSNKIANFNKEEDYYLETLKISDFFTDGSSLNLLLYSTKSRNLRFHVLSEPIYEKYIKRARNLDNYEYYKKNTAIDENLVFFESFHGKYNNNPKYIYEKLLELGYDRKFKFVWSFREEENEGSDSIEASELSNGQTIIPGNPIIVNDDDDEYYKYLASSKYRVNNATFLKIIDKRKGKVYLQTWHGSPLKKLGLDIDVENPGVSWNHFNNEVKTWNYLVSANDFSTKTFKRAFNFKNNVLELGYPANDIFYQDNENKINELKDRFGIDTDKKIILYAPTFRDNKVDEEGNRIFDLELDLNKLYNQLNDDYFLIIKTHYVVSKELEIGEEMKDFVIDLSSHDDIHELFILSDILITDYSSVFFDYAHSKRPILFFMPDLEEYISSRGVYEEILESLPGPKLVDNDELVNSLMNLEEVEKEYSEKYAEFYNSYCDKGHGNAAERIIEEVFGKLDE